MFKQFRELTVKQQFLCVIAMFAGYFSPLLGVILYIILRTKKADRLYQRFPLIGGALALLYYAVTYLISIAIM